MMDDSTRKTGVPSVSSWFRTNRVGIIRPKLGRSEMRDSKSGKRKPSKAGKLDAENEYNYERISSGELANL